jgi:hypothetical protein
MFPGASRRVKTEVRDELSIGSEKTAHGYVWLFPKWDGGRLPTLMATPNSKCDACGETIDDMAFTWDMTTGRCVHSGCEGATDDTPLIPGE